MVTFQNVPPEEALVTKNNLNFGSESRESEDLSSMKISKDNSIVVVRTPPIRKEKSQKDFISCFLLIPTNIGPRGASGLDTLMPKCKMRSAVVVLMTT